MTKEELLALGLTEEQITELFKINGKDVEKAKGDLATKEQELADTKKLLADANKEIEDFKELDVEGIKKAADDYKIKFEAAEQKAKEEIDKIKYEHSLIEYLNKFEFTNDRIKNSIKEDMKSKEFKLEDGKFLGADDYIKLLQENEPESFKLEEDKEKPPTFTRPGGGGKPEVVEDLGSALQDYYK